MNRLPRDLEAFILKIASYQKLGKPVRCWVYDRIDNKKAFAIVRFEESSENGITKKNYRPFHQCANRWRCSDPPGLLPLFRLPKIVDAKRVFVAEGEKCASAVAKLGLAATTSAHGARAAHNTDWSRLAGKQVVIMPDNDESGQHYATEVLILLGKLNPRPTVTIVRLTDLWVSEEPVPAGGDLVDWLDHAPDMWDDTACRNHIERVVAANAPSVFQRSLKSSDRPRRHSK